MSYKILIAEDNVLFSRSLERILKSAFLSMEIEVISDGDEVLAKSKDKPPDLIFMDIQLPGINGLQLTRKIQEIYPQTVIIILTSHDLMEYKVAASEAGADNFISKKTAKVQDILKVVESTGLKKTNKYP